MKEKVVKSINMGKNHKIKEKIESYYIKFFKEVGVDFKSGVLKNNKALKFATYPYIGDEYGKNTRILFIGLDIGKDEYQKSIGGFEKRQESIGNKENYNNHNKNKRTYNPHIAGTLVTAAYFSNKRVLGKIKNAKNYKDAIRILHTDIKNPLSYIALTNFYKFVTQKRNNRTGSNNRMHISPESRKHEWNLLLNEIKIFNPKIIIFQSVEFLHHKYKDFFNELKKENKKKIKIYIGPHPACRPPYSRIPKEYLGYFKLIDEKSNE